MRFVLRFAAGLAIALPLCAQYSGPAILARGEAPAAMTGVPIRFRPYVSVSGAYDTGLAGIAVTDQGQLATAASYGVAISGGISGTRIWKHTSIGLDYRGSWTDYAHNAQHGTYDQSFLLGIDHSFNRRMAFNLRETGGMFTRDFGIAGLSQTVPFDPTAAYVPTTDFFDNRTIYLTSQANLIYQLTRRLSFDIGGGLFINRRLSTALYGAVGESASGDIMYRLTRKSTLGLVYTYNHMGYTRVFGGSDVHGLSAAYSVRLNRTMEFTGTGGIVRQEDTFLQQVQIDPVIAALLGVGSSTQIYHDRVYHPHVSGRFSKTFRTGVVYVSGGNAVTPGNGLFLTSYATTAMGGYSYTGLRRWSIATSVADTWAQAFGNVSGNYGGLTGQISVTRRIVRSTSLALGYSARRYQSSDFHNYNRLIHSVNLGLTFSPGDVPLRIW